MTDTADSMDKEFNPVKSYLEDLEFYPDSDELERIILLSVRQDAYEHNKGIRHNRTETNVREMAFYKQWLEENVPVPGFNSGYGILQDLFIDSNPLSVMSGSKILEIITNRDRMIVATVIQWLGSNCGMSFLHQALSRFNSRIIEDKND